MKTIYITLILALGLTACDFAEFVNNENLSLRYTSFTLLPQSGETFINISNVSSVAVSGNCVQEGADVSFNFTSTVVQCNGSTYSAALDMTTVPEGSLSLVATIQDPDLGAISSSPITFVKDTVISVPTLVSPPDGSTLSGFSQSLQGSCESNATVFASGDVSGSPVSVVCSSGSYNMPVNFSVGDGLKNIQLYQVDEASNTSADLNASVTISTSGPATITIVTPSAGALVNLSNESSFSVSGLCGVAGALVTFNIGSGSTTCDGSNFSTNLDLSGEADGALSLQALSVDQFSSPISSATVALNKDTLAPSIAITSPTNGSVVNASSESSFAVSGACNEAGQTVSFNIGSGTATCDGSNFSTNLDLSGEADGALSLQASISDAAGNSSSSSAVSLNKDTLAPSIAITSPASGATVNASNESSFAVSGTCNEAGQTVTFNIGTGSASCNGSNFSTNLDLSGEADGALSLQALISDAAGNSSSSSAVSLNKAATPTSTLVYRTWNPNQNVELPLASGGSYNFTVDWGDGSPDSTVTSGTDPDRIHAYTTPGDYTVTLSGTANRIQSTCTTSLLLQADLGDMGWTNFDQAFDNCTQLTTVNIANTSGVTSMRLMFQDATIATPNTTGWDTSSVTDMTAMFSRTNNANPDTSGWDTSNVNNMSFMFSRAASANPDTSGWDTSSVTNMNAMFNEAPNANPITSGWNTANVTNMSGMFLRAISANPDTSGWDTSSVTDMGSMFDAASSANPDTSGWDTSNVTDMGNMFQLATNANPDTSGWNTSNVVNMNSMFSQSNASPDTSGWDTANVTNMRSMFQLIPGNPDTSGWDTSNVTDMSYMFNRAPNANPDTSGWNTANVTEMGYMFNEAVSANPDVISWDFSGLDITNTDIRMLDIFNLSGIDNANYSNFLIRLSDTAPATETGPFIPYDLGTIPAQYQPAAASSRADLISDGYNINDNGPE